MDGKCFILFKDLIVREADSCLGTNIEDEIGKIEYHKSNRYFFPNYFDKRKRGEKVQLWNFNFKEIQISKFFVLKSIQELEDDNQSRFYYKRILITVVDLLWEFDSSSLNSESSYTFYCEPDYILVYSDLEKYLQKICKELSNVRTFEAYNLNIRIASLEAEVLRLSAELSAVKLF